MTYADKLRDPRWQRRRLKVLEANDFTCRDCGAKDKPLHVHHAYYEKGAEPWNYPDTALLVLCEQCHEWRQLLQNCVLVMLGMIDDAGLLRVYAYSIGVWIEMSSYARSDVMARMPVPVGEHGAKGLQNALGVSFRSEKDFASLAAVIDEYDIFRARTDQQLWPTAESVCP